MKELSIEEKAKRYDEVLEKARQLCAYPTTKPFISDLQDLFPELKESEDERIRKEIIAFLKYYHTGQGKSVIFDENWIDWLEKQEQQKNSTDRFFEGFRQGEQCVIEQPGKYGLQKQGEQILANSVKTCKDEQKPTDKVKPKFRVGDWVARNGETLQISGIDTVLDGTFHYWFTKGTWLSSKKMENAMLWTIQDAKDGDVLCCESGWSCIFKALNSDISFSSYCFMDNTGWFCETGSESHTLEKTFIKAYNGNIYPATKEQRDALMKAMTDAGYTFDFDKKELKKIEQKPTDKVEPKFKVGDEIKTTNEESLTITRIDRWGYWSEDLLICNFDDTDKWELVEQKPVWSKEDEEIRKGLIKGLEDRTGFGWVSDPFSREEYINWLKSIRPQKHWSEEKLRKGLNEAANEWNSKASFSPFYMVMDGDRPTDVKQDITSHGDSFKAGVDWIIKKLKE